MQRQLYEDANESFKQNMAALKGDPRALFKRGGYILQVMNQLRFICGHPASVKECSPHLKKHLANRSPAASGKTARLMEILSEVFPRGEKVLVFVMRKALMYLLKEIVEKEHPGISVLAYSGDVAIDKRPALEEKFQSDASCQMLILTVDTGGVGLNLCAASHVVHFDRSYNPAKENQATDRAHRMGQKQIVCVHKLISKGSFEERLDSIVKRKAALGDVVDGMDANFISNSSDAEIIELFSLRADEKTAQSRGPAQKGAKRKHSGWEDDQLPDEKENLDTQSVNTAPRAEAEEEDDRNCVVCMDARKELLFTPCGHTCCCKGCGERVKQCPECRTDISSRKSLDSGASSSKHPRSG